MFFSDYILIIGLPLLILVHGLIFKHKFAWEWIVVSYVLMSVVIVVANVIILRTLLDLIPNPALAGWIRTLATIVVALGLFQYYVGAEKPIDISGKKWKRIRTTGASILVLGLVLTYLDFHLAYLPGFVLSAGLVVFFFGVVNMREHFIEKNEQSQREKKDDDTETKKPASETSKPVNQNTIDISSSHTEMNVQSSDAEAVDVATKQCPKCAETIKLEAIVCRFCGYEFNKNEVAEEIVREETQAKERKEYHELQSLIVKKRDTLKSLTRASRFYSGMAMFIWVVGGILFAFTTIVAFVELDVWIFLFYLSLFLLLFAAPATLLSRAASRKKKKISDLEEEILDLTAKCTKNESVEINNRGQTTII